MTQKELAEKVLTFNMTLSLDQRRELFEILLEFEKTEFKDLVPGIFLINPSPTLTEHAIQWAISEMERLNG
jgi:hypothetical protein